MIKGVIFDCFGVVIADGLEAVLLRREKEDPQLRRFVMDVIHRSNRGEIGPREAHRLIGEHLGISPENWRQEIYAGEERNPHVIGLIRNLRKQYKTAMLSNVGKGSLKVRFGEDELQELFDVVVASGEVGMAKPDPEIYQLVAEKLGLEVSECVFIDDRIVQVKGAEAAGMAAILYEDFDQMKTELEALLAKPLPS